MHRCLRRIKAAALSLGQARRLLSQSCKVRDMNHPEDFIGALRHALRSGIACTCLGMAIAPLANAAPAQADRPAGVPVKVTPEMTGAGIVSSGTVLPPIPPATGDRKNPVPSWGKPLPYPIVIADRRNNRLI
jgi:hypothetical protein